MPVTRGGVYHNIKESTYCVGNDEVIFFFSSDVYRQKFLNGYEANRKTFNVKMKKLIEDEVFCYNFLADMLYYKSNEKRGFYAWIKGVEIQWQDMYLYALGKMTNKNTKNWYEMQKPKLEERKRIMELI